MVSNDIELDKNAPEELCTDVINSFGVMAEVSNFLTGFEQTKLQATSMLFYETGVCRVQTKIQIPSQQLLTWPREGTLSDKVI